MAEIGTDIEKAVAYLKEGKLVGMPTETVYGLAGNASDEKVVASIFHTKDRPLFDPLILHFSSEKVLLPFVSKFPEKAQILSKHFWPGPLTLILPKTDLVPDITTAGQTAVAVRVPRHGLALELLKKVPFPVAAPSANPFGYISPTSAQHVQNQLGDKISYIVDGGECAIGLESTIVSFKDGEPVVVRLGGIPVEHIEKVIGAVKVRLSQNSNPEAPGQLDSHYSPKTRFSVERKLFHQLLKTKGGKVGLLRFDKPLTGYPDEYQFVLSPSSNLEEAGINLFKYMRMLDDVGFDLIIAEPVPEVGIGRAINDRLRRASHAK